MKILNITKDSYICSLSREELELIVGKNLHFSDLKQIFENELQINIKQIAPLISSNDIYNIEQSVKSLESAITYLNNKRESIKYLNDFKSKDRKWKQLKGS